ncbi:hypothetical protein [Kiritimatiella glycovorans]|uniref:Uncharacterized protein n=1 Tax=Kiritimatiella glycovorans TaxID=1307763 RepID=A0A0G3EDJ8_9BACT|nr:hypothetical protein [Kiritimatiella glycovorans]AKJ63462.1 hypothetical protein L21SP4_00178 [Kiritimatiella glycovorans]
MLCLRAYLPMIHLMRNEQAEYRAALAALKARDLTPAWRLVAGAIENPQRYDASLAMLANNANASCLLITCRALRAETEGDYTRAEELYMQVIGSEAFMPFLEYHLADVRLRVVAPLAAIQKTPAAADSEKRVQL